MESVAEERLRIAREIHDGIAQEIAFLGYRIDEIIGRNATPGDVRTSLRQLRFGITLLSESVRNEIFELRHTEPRTFAEQIDSILQYVLGESDINWSVSIKEDIPTQFHFNLLRVIQEAANNTLNHSAATSIDIRYQDRVFLFSDNGVIWNPPLESRWGIVGIDERARNMGAVLEITHNLDGTTMAISWPGI
ncbi:MAG: histidine kinase [Actinomycetes bacterium]|jgi:signal transduction histidine kinase